MEPPAIRREFRGTWVATVGNIDWPSKPGLPVQQQKDEMLAPARPRREIESQCQSYFRSAPLPMRDVCPRKIGTVVAFI